MTDADAIVAKLHAEHAKLRPLAEAVAQGDEEPETLHDLRVALRRMRTIVRELGEALAPEAGGALRDALRASAHATSEVRDLDVLLAAFDGYVAALPRQFHAGAEPLRAHLEARRHAARATLRRALREHPPPSIQPTLISGAEALDPLIQGRARRLSRRIRRHGRAAGPGSDATALHTLRKDVKRYRYLLELFPEVTRKKARKKTLRDLRELQTLLGNFQDREVHLGLLEASSVEQTFAPHALLTAGMLLLELTRAQTAAREALPAIFARYERRAKKHRRALSLRPSP